MSFFLLQQLFCYILQTLKMGNKFGMIGHFASAVKLVVDLQLVSRNCLYLCFNTHDIADPL